MVALEPNGVPSRAAIMQAILDAVPQSERKNTVVTTDAGGEAFVAFENPFDAPPVVVAIGGNGEQVTLPDVGAVSATGFTVVFTDAAGAPIASGLARLHYIAMEES